MELESLVNIKLWRYVWVIVNRDIHTIYVQSIHYKYYIKIHPIFLRHKLKLNNWN